jgi:dipeptidyl aminopeptidase/acylaminoacyl peptidase
MTDDRSLERAARSFIEAGPTQAPDRAVEAALLRIQTTPQERDLRVPWRFLSMTTPARVAVAALVGVLLVGAAAYYFGRPGQPAVGGPGPSPSSSAPASPIASPKAQTSAAPLDYTGLQGWIVFHHGGQAPDGSTPAGGDSGRGLWLVHADGSGLHELAPGIPAVGKVSQDISPDGTRVAFGADDIPAQIWQVGIEGGDPELLTTDCSGQPSECTDGAPAYSSDGSRIAFVRSTEATSVLAILDLSSGEVTTLEPTRKTSSTIWLSEPSWSPDDQQIVYHDVHRDDAQDKNVDANIFIVNADGSGLHELAVLDGTPVGDADWSPDGSRIVFSSCPIRDFNDACAAVYTARPDGTDVQLLTPTNVGYGAPSWTPDGLHIMYWGPVTFHMMDPDGSNPLAINRADLTFDVGYGYYAYLQPTP